MMWQQTIVMSLLSGLLVACGGDGSSPDKKNNTPIPDDKSAVIPEDTVDNKNFVVVGDVETQVGKMVALVAYLRDDEVKRYKWTQLSGSQAELSSSHQGVITFIAPKTGVYDFEVNVETQAGKQLNKHISVTVNPSDNKHIEILKDRAIKGGRNFVMHLPSAMDMTDITVSPEKSNSNIAINIDKQSRKVYVRVGKVQTTQLITLNLKKQGTILDIAFILVERNLNINSNYFCDGQGIHCATTEPLNRMLVYKADSPYKNVLEQCTFSNTLTYSSLCSVAKLPPLGMQNNQVNDTNITNRLIVDELWMGQRFEEFLLEMDRSGDFKKLFGSVTAVIISDSIEVPFYWALTGAIYLNPSDLYQNRKEYLSLERVIDYRKPIKRGAPVQFLWQYTYEGESITLSKDITDRNKEKTHLNLASLLYHELAHANDFYPYNELSDLDKTKKLISSIHDFSQLTSYKLGQLYPLNSVEMKSIAKYSFQGYPLSDSIMHKNTQNLANSFLLSGANDLYSFVNDKEDMAMLFEETMMKFRFNVDREVAMVTGKDDIILFQQKNRVFDQNVRHRALVVSQSILPHDKDDIASFFMTNIQ